MTDLALTDTLFFERTGMDPRRVEALVAEALAGMDDGELYLEYSQSEGLALDDGRIKERGTHAQLLELGGVYARMWALQQEQANVPDSPGLLQAA